MKVQIRTATLKDLTLITALNQELFDFEETLAHDYNLDWPKSDIGQKYFKKSITNSAFLTLIAEVDGEPAGYIISYIALYPYRRINPICEIDTMIVIEKYRNLGIGTKLVAEIKKFAKRNNAKVIRVGAIAQNGQAVQFYKKNGFAETNIYLETKV